MSTKGCCEKCRCICDTRWKEVIEAHKGCDNRFCPCHQDTKQGWRERFDDLMTYKVNSDSETMPFPTFPCYPGYEALTSFIEKEITLAVEGVVELSGKHAEEAYELGVKHGIQKTCARFKINELEALSTLTK